MARPRIRAKRWEHPYYRYAYIIERRGLCHTIIDGGNPRVIKGLKFHPNNKNKAIRELDYRLQQYQRDKAPKEAPKSVLPAIEEFISIILKEHSEATISRYIMAYKKMIPEDLPLDDPLLIGAEIKKNYMALNQAGTRGREIMLKVRRLLDYCFNQGYIQRNPVTKEMIPRVPSPSKNVYTADELERLLEVIPRLQGHKRIDLNHFRQFIQFISLSGLRRLEVLKLYWDYDAAPYISQCNQKSLIIMPDKIIIDGKRSKYDVPRIRELPIELVPGLLELLNEIYEYKDANKGKVFKWGLRIDHLAYLLGEANRAAGIDPEKKFHALRNYAVNYWEKELNYPPHICSYMAGHGIGVREKHYSHTPTANELKRMVRGRIPE